MNPLDNMKIRRANPTAQQDAQGILEVHRRSIHGIAASFYSVEIIAEWGSLPITPEMIARFIESKAKGEIIYVAEVFGKIVAFSEVVPENDELRAVYVDPDFGRLGLGAKLLKAVEIEAKNAGCEKLWLHSSINAKDFYEHSGYIVIKPEEHTLPSGRKMPCFAMEKHL